MNFSQEQFFFLQPKNLFGMKSCCLQMGFVHIYGGELLILNVAIEIEQIEVEIKLW